MAVTVAYSSIIKINEDHITTNREINSGKEQDDVCYSEMYYIFQFCFFYISKAVKDHFFNEHAMAS